jgi:hypothetical protein
MFEVHPRGIGFAVVGLAASISHWLDGPIGGGAFDGDGRNGTWALMAPCQDVAAGRLNRPRIGNISTRALVTTRPADLAAKGA